MLYHFSLVAICRKKRGENSTKAHAAATLSHLWRDTPSPSRQSMCARTLAFRDNCLPQFGHRNRAHPEEWSGPRMHTHKVYRRAVYTPVNICV